MRIILILSRISCPEAEKNETARLKKNKYVLISAKINAKINATPIVKNKHEIHKTKLNKSSNWS